jgi:amino acid transporter
MIGMIGVGPFITIPVLLAKMGGPQAMLGWVLGAVVALCDGMVWAELGAAMPDTAGPLRYLPEAYGPRRLGRVMSFLFIWQTIFLAPLSIASGAIGFAQYAKYLTGDIGWWQEKGIAMAVCLLITFLLYRDIRTVAKLSVGLWVVVVGTVIWIAAAGLGNFNAQRLLDFPADAFTSPKSFFFGLGGATLIAMYDYGGYNSVCFFAGEVRNPGKVIPRSIIWSIVAVGCLYLTMNAGIISVVPWREAMRSTAVVSDFMQRLYGPRTAQAVTVLVLWTTLASLFSLLLANSRVPYAAAAEGRFFQVFGRLHSKRDFPGFSVIFIGVSSAVACLLTLEVVINALIVIQVLVQSIAQVVAVVLLRRNRPDMPRPYKMPIHPLTSGVALAGWLYILVASGLRYIVAGIILLIVGIAAYLWRAREAGEWPFAPEGATA